MDISSSFSGNRKATIITVIYPSKHCYNWKIDLVKLRLPFSHHPISGHTLLCPDPIGPYLKTLSRHLPADPLGQAKSHTYLAWTTPWDWMEAGPLLWTIADCEQIKLMQLLSDTSITTISSCSPCQQNDALGINITDNEIQVQLMWSDWLIKITNFANGLSHKRSANWSTTLPKEIKFADHERLWSQPGDQVQGIHRVAYRGPEEAVYLHNTVTFR